MVSFPLLNKRACFLETRLENLLAVLQPITCSPGSITMVCGAPGPLICMNTSRRSTGLGVRSWLGSIVLYFQNRHALYVYFIAFEIV